ncbi:NitT/TauT family transport system permease protein [Microbacterium trichothecenolyticum]|uniref:ABC transporter permease n=1 Tax=Microbacterium trichothecenolyticum TaxID=69370 RepID=UPI00285CCB04|nr:ABC transporter permease subunit [Microbacterium trichothecenolyticum]MDR7184792.1 NitT/TauT family transport system permease protein [Microbacterium trichothecenolyticum]
MNPGVEAVLKRVLPPLALLVFGIALVQVLVTALGIPPFVLASPAAIWDEIVAYLPAIASATLVTGLNALWGLLLGSVIGIALAVLASRTKVIDGMLAPIVAAIAVVPIVALAPVLYTMFGSTSETARVLIAGIAAFVPIFLNTLRGLRQVRPVQRDLLRALAATPGQVIRSLTIPAALPHFFTGLRVASSLAVISALVAEYFGGPRQGLGAAITTAAANSAYARAWAFVLGAIVLGLAFFLITSLIERAFLRFAR